MVFGINPVEMAKKELLKLDFDRDKKPDIFEALDAAEAGLDKIAKFLSGFTQEEAKGILNALNNFRAPANRLDAKMIEETAASVVKLPGDVQKIKTLLEELEESLK